LFAVNAVRAYRGFQSVRPAVCARTLTGAAAVLRKRNYGSQEEEAVQALVLVSFFTF